MKSQVASARWCHHPVTASPTSAWEPEHANAGTRHHHQERALLRRKGQPRHDEEPEGLQRPRREDHRRRDPGPRGREGHRCRGQVGHAGLHRHPHALRRRGRGDALTPRVIAPRRHDGVHGELLAQRGGGRPDRHRRHVYTRRGNPVRASAPHHERGKELGDARGVRRASQQSAARPQRGFVRGVLGSSRAGDGPRTGPRCQGEANRSRARKDGRGHRRGLRSRVPRALPQRPLLGQNGRRSFSQQVSSLDLCVVEGASKDGAWRP